MRTIRVLALLLIAELLAGCGRKPRPEPPGFASLPPVPKEFQYSDSPEVAKRAEVLRSIYTALGSEAHWKLKEERRVTFRFGDVPEKSREALRAFLQTEGTRDWVESKVGRPPDFNRLTFVFTGSPGGVVQFAVLDPANPEINGGLNCDYIGGWPASKGGK